MKIPLRFGQLQADTSLSRTASETRSLRFDRCAFVERAHLGYHLKATRLEDIAIIRLGILLDRDLTSNRAATFCVMDNNAASPGFLSILSCKMVRETRGNTE